MFGYFGYYRWLIRNERSNVDVFIVAEKSPSKLHAKRNASGFKGTDRKVIRTHKKYFGREQK